MDKHFLNLMETIHALIQNNNDNKQTNKNPTSMNTQVKEK